MSASAPAKVAATSSYDRLRDLIQSKQAVIGVIGLGYVGLPLVGAFTVAGFRCLGFDVDQAKVEKLSAGESYIKHIDSNAIVDLIRDNHGAPVVLELELCEPSLYLAYSAASAPRFARLLVERATD